MILDEFGGDFDAATGAPHAGPDAGTGDHMNHHDKVDCEKEAEKEVAIFPEVGHNGTFGQFWDSNAGINDDGDANAHANDTNYRYACTMGRMNQSIFVWFVDFYYSTNIYLHLASGCYN